MPRITEVAVVGAGPCGLSIAAHLTAKERGTADLRPADTDMALRYAGRYDIEMKEFPSSLHDLEDTVTLGVYCTQQGEPYATSDFQWLWEPLRHTGSLFSSGSFPLWTSD